MGPASGAKATSASAGLRPCRGHATACVARKPLTGRNVRTPGWSPYEGRRLSRRVCMFQAALEAAPNAMVMVDGEGKIVFMNAEAEALFGRERGETLGEQLEILL